MQHVCGGVYAPLTCVDLPKNGVPRVPPLRLCGLARSAAGFHPFPVDFCAEILITGANLGEQGVCGISSRRMQRCLRGARRRALGTEAKRLQPPPAPPSHAPLTPLSIILRRNPHRPNVPRCRRWLLFCCLRPVGGVRARPVLHTAIFARLLHSLLVRGFRCRSRAAGCVASARHPAFTLCAAPFVRRCC